MSVIHVVLLIAGPVFVLVLFFKWRTILWLPRDIFLWARTFAQYCFDIYPRRRELSSDPPRPSKWDRERLLHLSWHCVVFVPVIVVGAVAKILKAEWGDVLFFWSLAGSTVALETCVGVILDKANELADLSRQTKRAIKLNDAEAMRGWVRYFMMRHQYEKSGIAKAALITVVSVVMFSAIVGVEAIRMREHALEEKPADVLDCIVSLKLENVTITPEEREKVISEYQLRHQEKTNEETDQLFLVICLAISMVAIAIGKVWSQTRAGIHISDAMDHFETPDAAIKMFIEDPQFHLGGEDEA